MRIHFEDHGQDFLIWQVTNNGYVVDSHPFQAFQWCGVQVLSLGKLMPGKTLRYRRGTEIKSIRYPIWAIEVDMTAEQFNGRYPIGARCRYYPLAGESKHSWTRTRTPAWQLGHGATVVSIEGVRGGVDINHLVMEG